MSARFFSAFFFLILLGVPLQAESLSTSVIGEALPTDLEGWDQLLAPFIERARRELPAALEKFSKAQITDEPVSLLLVTRRRGSDGNLLKLIMEVREVTATGLINGSVVGDPPDSSPLKTGDSIGIMPSEVYDLALTNSKGEVEGFYLTRASNAYSVGAMVVVFELQSDAKGRLISVSLVTAVNPLNHEKVLDLLPPGIEADGRAFFREYYKTRRVPDRFTQMTLFYHFPDGKRLDDPEIK